MFDDFFVALLLNLLSFYIFYFNVPCWTGSELQDLSSNGIYRACFCFCSSVGYGMHKLLESAQSKLFSLLNRSSKSPLYNVVNFLLYTIMLHMLMTWYEFSMGIVIGGEVAEIKFDISSTHSRYSDFILYLGVFEHFMALHAERGFIFALQESVFRSVVFVICTVFHFSVLYGFLSPVMESLNLVEKFCKNKYILGLLGDAYDPVNVIGLARSILANTVEFCNELAILQNFRKLSVQIASAALIVVHSVMMSSSGDSPSISSFILDTMGEMGIISTVFNFVLNVVVLKLVFIVCSLVYSVLPENIQESLDSLSKKGNSYVEVIKDRRGYHTYRVKREYAERHEVKELHLE